MSATDVATRESLLTNFQSPAALQYRRVRQVRDAATRYVMAVGGISVIVAIVLIAFYLIYVVLPLFYPARVDKVREFAPPGGTGAASLYYAVEEQREIGLRITADGRAVFFRARDGSELVTRNLTAETTAQVVSFGAGDPAQYTFALGMSDGTAVIAKHHYSTSFVDEVRRITPDVIFPIGGAPQWIDPAHRALEKIAAQFDGDQLTVVAVTSELRLLLVNLSMEKTLFGETPEIKRTDTEIPIPGPVTHLALDVDQRELYFTDHDGFIYYYDISRKEEPRLIQRVTAVPDGVDITSLEFLSGGISLLVGDSRGEIAQWFPVRDQENNYTLDKIRSFRSQSSAIAVIRPEYYRKGFLAIDDDGTLGLYHATAGRTVKLVKIEAEGGGPMAIAPRADGMLIESGQGTLEVWDVRNRHPEVSWQSLWGKVWYESRQQPEFIWQSSSASSDFEPKFSLTPLAFGTLKAALYALLFAVPLAIMGAIYTAYFMSAGMRNIVKPSVEIMAALPSVILGFLAGLWFAPFLEKHLPSIFLLIVLLPAVVLGASWTWSRLPLHLRQRMPEGTEATLLVPIMILTLLVAVALSQPVEVMFFDGSMPLWLTRELGITFDQRNSLVVGIAIGFAVIPTIFSISEDAIFGVPKHLTTGSLALGATPWQTMVRVVLLTASPGIFSAVMIGLGRAVGETMIVVMATGNTAVMDLSIFQGFRALSANIAVEMPESEVGSTHYRVLFLAGLVLFIATFVFNTVAEVVRQRLRVKYSTL
ncbi:MAG: ABC transporter permease subunit [Gammaproteobacteria bacterium]|nr:ABC transporter permease subunit [Gammaproteobacteria bacterium]